MGEMASAEGTEDGMEGLSCRDVKVDWADALIEDGTPMSGDDKTVPVDTFEEASGISFGRRHLLRTWEMMPKKEADELASETLATSSTDDDLQIELLMPMPKAVLWAVEGFPWPDGWTPEPEWTPSGARDSGDDSDSSPSAGFVAKSAGKGPARSSEASMRAEVRDFEAEAEAQLELVESEKSCDESVDVVFIIDVTGSMSNQIEGVKQMIRSYCHLYGGQAASDAGIRIHIVTYTEHTKQVFTSHFTSSSASRLVAYVDRLRTSVPPDQPWEVAHGGDGEENVLHALAALHHEPHGRIRLPLNRRLLAFIITDAPPHNRKQQNSEATLERDVLNRLGFLRSDGTVDMYHVLNKVINDRKGRIVFVPIMYGVGGESLHFYAQAACVTQGMLLRATGTDSQQLANSLAKIVNLVSQMLKTGMAEPPDALEGFDALRIDALQEATDEDDPRIPPPQAAADIKTAILALLDSVRDLSTAASRWENQCKENDSSEEEEEMKIEEDVKEVLSTKPLAVGKEDNLPVSHWHTDVSPVHMKQGGRLRFTRQHGSCQESATAAGEGVHDLEPEALPGLGLQLSMVRLIGLDPCFGAVPHPVACVGIHGCHISGQRCSVDVVLAIDVSYSMCSVIEQVRQATNQVYETLQSNDRIAIVIFANDAVVLLKLTRKSDVTQWAEVLQSIKPQGATNIEAALRLSFGLLPLAGACAVDSQDEQPSTRCLLFLSDGCPNRGIRSADRLCRLARRRSKRRNVTIHSLGFTDEHDIDFMSALPRCGSGPQGSYYYLTTSQDITASIGDSLGNLRPVACDDLAMLCESPDGDSVAEWLVPNEIQSEESPGLLVLQRGIQEIGCLQSEERQARLLVLPELATDAVVRFSWKSMGKKHEATARLCVSDDTPTVTLLEDEVAPALGTTTVVGHALRLHVARALTVLASPGENIVGRYDSLHQAVLRLLASIEHCCATGPVDKLEHEEDAVFLEGMMQALERDLGEALGRRASASKEERGVLLSFALEHLTMHSASSLTRCRAAYSCRSQVRMRLKFLQCSAKGDADMREKVPLEEADLTEEEMSCRMKADEHGCFVTLGGWRDSILGLGLFVHPRTVRERQRNLPPEVDLVLDYVCAEAYNLGVRATVAHAPTDRQQGEGDDDDGDDDEDEVDKPAARVDVLTSSSRKRINGWLPLYLNSAHWAAASALAPSAFSLITTQLNSAFQPLDALRVCCRLLVCVVVGFVHPDKMPKVPEHRRATASEAAVQMYCDVHRLLHEMANTYPEIKETVLTELHAFINDPEKRTRRKTPNLGDLMSYLSIVDEVSWEDLAPCFVPEMVRRASTRFKEPFDAQRCKTTEDIIARFDELEPDHGLVILFNKVFNAEVARPNKSWNLQVETQDQPLSCRAVLDLYDRRWGQLPERRCTRVLEELKRIRGLGSIVHVLQELVPSKLKEDDIGELILWAARNAGNNKALHLAPDMRTISYSRQNLDEWKVTVMREHELVQEAQKLLESSVVVMEEAIARMVLKARELEACTSQKCGFKFPSKEEACRAAATARWSAEQVKKEKGLVDAPKSSSDKWASREDRDTAWSLRYQSFSVRVKYEGAADEGLQHLVIQDVNYWDWDNYQPFTGKDLKHMICSQTGLDHRVIVLVVHQEKDEAPLILGNDRTMISCSLMNAREVEVMQKKRGGKKPGRGWNKNPPKKQDNTLNIAGAIARCTTFARVSQFFTRMSDGKRTEWLIRFCEHMGQDPVVLCSSTNSASALRHQLLQYGGEEQSDTTVVFAKRRFILLAEKLKESTEELRAAMEEKENENTDAAEDRTMETTREPQVKALNLSGSMPDEREVRMPSQAWKTKLVVVYDSLHEAASLGDAVRSVRPCSDEDVIIMHLVSNVQSVYIWTEDQRQQVAALLGEDNCLKEELTLVDQRLPPTALLNIDTDVNGPLPMALDFTLRVQSLGFVVRLQNRFGCTIPEIHLSALKVLLNCHT